MSLKLKLKYFFKTDATTRRVDWADYDTEREKLLYIGYDCLDKRQCITGSLELGDVQDYIAKGEKFCFYEDKFKFDFHPCLFADMSADGNCLNPGPCSRKLLNQLYIDQYRAYWAQREIVRNFWTKRMTERVQHKGIK